MALKTVGERHPSYRKCLNLMGVICTDLEEHSKAQQMLEKCCKLIRESIGINNIRYAQSLMDYTNLLRKMGNYH